MEHLSVTLTKLYDVASRIFHQYFLWNAHYTKVSTFFGEVRDGGWTHDFAASFTTLQAAHSTNWATRASNMNTTEFLQSLLLNQTLCVWRSHAMLTEPQTWCVFSMQTIFNQKFTVPFLTYGDQPVIGALHLHEVGILTRFPLPLSTNSRYPTSPEEHTHATPYYFPIINTCCKALQHQYATYVGKFHGAQT